MSLVSELTEAGTPPARLDVRCTITMDEVEGAGHRIVASAIEARGQVADVSQETFAALAEKADAGCPFSHLIRASASVTVSGHAREPGVERDLNAALSGQDTVASTVVG